MEMRAETTIGVPPERAWEVVGERFGGVAEWATPILTSHLTTDDAAAEATALAPAEGIARVCGIGGFGPFPAGEITERLTVFDRSARRLEYRAVHGLPRMMRSAVNRWSVHPDLDDQARSVVKVHATVRLAWWALPLAPFMAWQLGRGGRDVLDDLRRHVETARPRADRGQCGGMAV